MNITVEYKIKMLRQLYTTSHIWNLVALCPIFGRSLTDTVCFTNLLTYLLICSGFIL